jgi:hypothetical protein
MLPTATNILGPIIAPLGTALQAAFLGAGGLAVGIMVTVWALKKGWLLFKGILDDTVIRTATFDIPNDSGSMAWWSNTAEYREGSSGSDSGSTDYESSAAQDSAAVSYLDRYRQSGVS